MHKFQRRLTMLCRTSIVVCMAALLSPADCNASPLPPGGTLFPAPNEANPVGGTVIASKELPFFGVAFSGKLKSEVILGDTSNPLGGLTFTYLIKNDSTSSHALHRFSITNFSTVNIDASYLDVPGLVSPFELDRSTADVFGALFGDLTSLGYTTIRPGESSSLLVVQTDAAPASYFDVLATVANGSPATVGSYAPAPTPTSVPEPSTVALALGSISMLPLLRVAKKRMLDRSAP